MSGRETHVIEVSGTLACGPIVLPMPARSCALILIMIAATSCTRVSEQFEDASVARQEGFFEQGWLPDVLPKEAGPIVEIHDLDTNARCSRTDLPTTFTSQVESSLRQEGFATYTSTLPDPPFNNCPFTVETAQRADIILMRKSPLEKEVAVLNRSSGVLLFWAAGPE